jgi:hypothetical protein
MPTHLCLLLTAAPHASRSRFFAPTAAPSGRVPRAPAAPSPDTADVVIVGAGVAGLYAALRLLERGVTVLLLERAPRLGGRILTETQHGHVLEYGPMRFEPDLQPRFASLVRDELRLAVDAFAPYTAPMEDRPDLNALPFEEVRALHEAPPGLAPAFALLRHGVAAVLGCQWDVARDDVRAPGRDARKAWLKRHGCFQGRPLWRHGLWDTLAHVLSAPALAFLMQRGTFYHCLHVNPNAADSICFLLDVLATARCGLVTLRGGSEQLTGALRARLAGRAPLRLRARVEALQPDAAGGVQLQLADGSSVRARSKVLLTCPQSALQQLRGLPPSFAPLLPSVACCALYKIFAVLADPPFGAHDVPTPNFGADKLPCRELHYGYSAATGTGLVMVYGDVPSLHYWQAFLPPDERCGDAAAPGDNASAHLRHHLAFYLRAIFAGRPRGDTFSIAHCGVLDWSCAGTGIHLWRPGFVSEDVTRTLARGAGGVAVCGEAYSTYQGFIEGSLRAVDLALQHI